MRQGVELRLHLLEIKERQKEKKIEEKDKFETECLRLHIIEEQDDEQVQHRVKKRQALLDEQEKKMNEQRAQVHEILKALQVDDCVQSEKTEPHDPVSVVQEVDARAKGLVTVIFYKHKI